MLVKAKNAPRSIVRGNPAMRNEILFSLSKRRVIVPRRMLSEQSEERSLRELAAEIEYDLVGFHTNSVAHV
jgi:hypothetical protein